MANFCLPPKLVDTFKKALIDGTIDPEKLAGMTSAERRDVFKGIVGEGAAKDVNSLFESKLLLKNQQQGFITWAKKVANISPAVRSKLTDKIAKIDHLLSPEEEKNFLHDLVSTKLGVDVTLDEANKISELSRKVQETQALPRSTPAESVKKGWQPTANDMQHGYALYDFHQTMSDLTNEARKVRLADLRGREVTTIPLHILKTLADVSKSIGASLDDSFALRQGLKSFWTNNAAWRKEFIASFGNIVRAFKNSDVANRELTARLMADPMYDTAIKDGLAIHGNEDAFPTSLPEKIPVLGRAFGASEVAYNSFAQNLRLNIYKQQMRLAMSLGDDIPKNYGKNMAKMVNSLTGRGSFGALEPASGVLNIPFYSLRFLKSNLDTLVGHPLGIGIGGIGSAAQKKAATNLLKILIGTGGVLATANALKPGSVDFDPRSADFGKIKIGQTRFDVSGGMGAIATLGARFATQSSKSSTTGVVTPLNTGKFGSQSTMDVLLSFMENKASPVGGVAVDVLKGKTHDNQKPSIGNEALNLFEPLNVKNILELASNPKSANILVSVLADTFGISTNTYGQSTKNFNMAPSATMTAFKNKVGDTKFQQANQDYNNELNTFMADNNDQLQALSNGDKASTISAAKAKIQVSIYKKYGFTPPKAAPASKGKVKILQTIH